MKRILLIDGDIKEWSSLIQNLDLPDVEIHWNGSLHFGKDLVNTAPNDYFDLIVVNCQNTLLVGYKFDDVVCEVQADHNKIIIYCSMEDCPKELQDHHIYTPKAKLLHFLQSYLG